MVNATNSDGNSSDTTDQGGEMVRNYKMKALQQDEQTGDQKKWTIWDSRSHTQAEVQPTVNISTHKSERQVLMQYTKAAHRWSIS